MKPRVLIVEDESIVAMDLEATLERLGYEVAGVLDRGEEAVRTAGSLRVDVVLMDIGLGHGIDGIATAEELRKGADLPVVFVTANADEATLERAMRSEPFGYVLKPFQPRELRTTLEMAIQKHRLERELRASRRWFETVLRSIGDGVIATDGAGKIQLLNGVAETLTGWTQQEAQGRPLLEVFRIIDQGSRQPVPDPVAKVLSSGQIVTLQNHTVLLPKGGAELQIDDAAAPIHDDLGAIIGVVLTFRDVTAKYLAEQARQTAENRYRALFEAVGDGVVVIDEENQIVAVNPAAEAIFGYEPGTLLGQDVLILMTPSWRRQHRRFFEFFRDSPLPTRFNAGRELLGQRQDGSTFFLELTISEMEVGGRRQFAGLVRDISGRKALEDQLILAQKMEGIGRLAGGVAHDFNNLLTAIISYGTLLRDDLDPSDERHSDVLQILAAAERAGGLTKQLLAFARRQIVEPRVVDLRVLLKGLQPLLSRALREDIDFRLNLADEVACVRIDPGQLERVFLNLAVNAKDAMPQGGSLRVDVQALNSEGPRADQHPEVPPGRYVVVRFTDSGGGMNPEVLSRVFEPFFTTKEVGGTGLGLATSYGIVVQSGGYLTVESELSKGTTFTIFLPAVDQPAEAVAPAESGPSKPVNGELVLVCEDNPIVREATLRALKAFGYRTLEAAGGAEALAIARAQRGHIDLLLTDVVMPGLGGAAVAEAMLKERPSLRVLYMSGYTDTSIVQEGELQRDVAFIAKPFTPARLVAKIKETLAGPPRGRSAEPEPEG